MTTQPPTSTMRNRNGFTGKLLSWILLVMLLPHTLLSAEPVEIVRGQATFAYILLPAKAHAIEKEAAQDLQWAVRSATGVTLQLLEEPPTTGRLIPIRIGQTACQVCPSFQAGSLDWDGLPYDGALIEAQHDGISIAGPTVIGTANGIATVLLEDIGIRTYYPHKLFTVIPRTRDIRIHSRIARPSFDYRVWSGIIGDDAVAYRRRNRLSDHRIAVPYFGFGHNLGRIVSVTEFGQDHPEYFAFRDGARQPHGTNVGDMTQPCFTNPEVVRLTIDAARRFFDKNPDRNTFSLCVNDNPRYCECEHCTQLDQPYRDLPVGRQYSESYYDYVSNVADAIAQSHPDRFVGVYAYWNVEQPPRNRKKLPANVIVALTLDILQHYDPEYQAKDRALVKAWSQYAGRLHTYVYYGLGWYTPRTSPKLVAEDLRFAAENGVRAIYCEAYPFWGWCGPMHYVAARLQWDVHADVDLILEEFHRDCFGEAASEMRAFHDTCEQYWTRARTGRWFEGLDRLGPEEAMADTSLLRKAAGHLDAAAKQARSSRVRKRIEWIRKGFDFTIAIGDAFDVRKAGGAPAQRLARLVDAANTTQAAHAWLAKEPAYRHSYYVPAPRFDRKCWGWFKGPVVALAREQFDQINRQSPSPSVKAAWEEFKQTTGLSKLLDQHGWSLDFEQSLKKGD